MDIKVCSGFVLTAQRETVATVFFVRKLWWAAKVQISKQAGRVGGRKDWEMAGGVFAAGGAEEGTTEKGGRRGAEGARCG